MICCRHPCGAYAVLAPIISWPDGRSATGLAVCRAHAPSNVQQVVFSGLMRVHLREAGCFSEGALRHARLTLEPIRMTDDRIGKGTSV